MNHWLEKSKATLIPLSEADDFTDAQREWQFTGLVVDYEDEDQELACELCSHPELTHHFQIQNKVTSHVLLVGSSCILRFSGIEVLDDSKAALTSDPERKRHLEGALRKQLVETMLEPVRRLWQADLANRSTIEAYGFAIKEGAILSPWELAFVFRRCNEFNIDFNAKRYKVSLRSLSHQDQLRDLPQHHRLLIKPALSASQLKKYAEQFTET